LFLLLEVPVVLPDLLEALLLPVRDETTEPVLVLILPTGLWGLSFKFPSKLLPTAGLPQSSHIPSTMTPEQPGL
jgi:hypothetical protein